MNYMKEIIKEYLKTINKNQNYFLKDILNSKEHSILKQSLIEKLEDKIIQLEIDKDIEELTHIIDSLSTENINIKVDTHNARDGSKYEEIKFIYGFCELEVSISTIKGEDIYVEQEGVINNDFETKNFIFKKQRKGYGLELKKESDELFKDVNFIESLSELANKIINKKVIFNKTLNFLGLFVEENSKYADNFNSIYKEKQTTVQVLFDSLKEDCDVMLLNDIKISRIKELENIQKKMNNKNKTKVTL